MATRDDAILADLLAEVETQDAGLLALLDQMAGKAAPTEQPDGADEPGGDGYKEQYGVIVICNDATHQERVYNELIAAGHNCRVVVT